MEKLQLATDIRGKIISQPDVFDREHRGRTIIMDMFDIPGIWLPVRYDDCSHNQLAAVHNRVLKNVPQATPLGAKYIKEALRIMKRSAIPTDLETLEHFLDRYSGSKRQRYERAAADYSTNGLRKRDYRCTTFVKCENVNPVAKHQPDPRPIQFRSPVFNVAISTYLKPIEEHIYNLKLHGKYYGNTPVIAKGFNSLERARIIREKMDRFEHPCVVSIDGKRFDMHVNRKLLRAEHRFYSYYNKDPFFMKLLQEQLRNKCGTRRGLRYETDGGRMSGDMNTGLGNCVVSVLMFVAYVQCVLKCKADIFVDGDDALIFIEEENLALLQSTLYDTYIQFGMEMEIADVAREMEEIDWCQTRPVLIDGQYRMIRNPLRVMSHVLVGKKWVKGRQQDLMTAIALCEMALNRGVPVLQEMAMAMWRNGGGYIHRLFEVEMKDPIFWRAQAEASWKEIAQRGPDPREVGLETRLSFFKAFGISPETQKDWERYFKTWTASFGRPREVSSVLDPVSWTYTFEAPIGYNEVATATAAKQKPKAQAESPQAKGTTGV